MTRQYSWLADPGEIMQPSPTAVSSRKPGKVHETPFHHHTDACVWTDTSLPATAGWGGMPMRTCQFGGIQDLRSKAGRR